MARLEISGYPVSQSTISGWVNGRHQPPLSDPEFANVLADALRMSVKSILISAGYRILDNGHTDEGEQAAYIVDQLPPEQRKIALSILEQFLQK